jgi:hypothetical protein
MMAWTWDQSKGELLHDGVFIANGYSGAELGKNNPAMQAARGVGPIPRGQWTMTGVENGGPTGPFTIVLSPCTATDTCGRSAFRIHGDSIAHPGTASHGCIILPRAIRERIWDSLDHVLEVVA